jgi:phosphopantetheine adenylyltransferase
MNISLFSGVETENKTSDVFVEKKPLATKKSFESFNQKVAALRQKLELKAHTKQEIVEKYTTSQKGRLRSKPKLLIMADSPDGEETAAKFKNIRMMFESK